MKSIFPVIFACIMIGHTAANELDAPLTLNEQERLAVLESSIDREERYFTEIEKNPFIEHYNSIPYEIVSTGEPFLIEFMHGKLINVSISIRSAYTQTDLEKPIKNSLIRYSALPTVIRSLAATTAERGGTIRYYIPTVLAPTYIKKQLNEPLIVELTVHSIGS